ncbi:hypothetical protein CQ054_21685 [Ochrobactrum sp. MYb29]|nr:hypothetical protein CQ054_21685 [Ochrobactrum sp. MYb29]
MGGSSLIQKDGSGGLFPTTGISHHLKKLRQAGLVKMRKDRQMRYCALTTTLTASFLGNSLVQKLLLLRH